MNFEELQYSLPDIHVVDAVKRAVDVLQEISNTDSGCLFYVLQPSNVLALAGLRAQSPYNEFGTGFHPKRQKLLARLLKSRGYALLPNTSPYAAEQRNTFSIVCPEVLTSLPEQYGVIQGIWKKPRVFDDLADFEFWSEYFETSLVDMMSRKLLPRDWLQDWWAPHNIRFGMLLGYPGQAIASFCWNEARYMQGKPVAHGASAELPYQGLYAGAHVSYDYAAELDGHPVLRAHQTLWTDVLHGVYAAFSEARTMQLAKFNEEFKKFN